MIFLWAQVLPQNILGFILIIAILDNESHFSLEIQTFHLLINFFK